VNEIIELRVSHVPGDPEDLYRVSVRHDGRVGLTDFPVLADSPDDAVRAVNRHVFMALHTDTKGIDVRKGRDQ